MRVLLAFLLAVTAFDAAAASLAAGPMPGHTGMRAVQVWLQADGEGAARLVYWPAGDPGSSRITPPTALRAGAQHAATITVGDLEPGTAYAYRVLIDGIPQEVAAPLRFSTQPLWRWRGEPPDFDAVVGSCAYLNDPPFDRPGKPYGGEYGIFDRIAETGPDFMLWLGDNLYLREADYDTPWGMAARWRTWRAAPEVQSLLRGTHHYAIWDDHDYGPNNANRSFVHKGASLELFRRYWANPSYGLPGAPGTYTSFSFHDVDFFLLDGRWYRDHDDAPADPGKQLFGPAQIAWLQNALLHSRASFKVIAAGGQMLNDDVAAEGWHHFPQERDAFLGWLETTGVPGVVFVSGDRHHTELLRRERDDAYPLYELTCSPLTSGPREVAGDPPREQRVEGTLVGRRNYCRLAFAGARDDRRLTVGVFASDGSPLWSRQIRAAALR